MRPVLKATRLECRDVVMQFPAVRALDGVSLTFEPGEVHGIVGENGAGKSTLVRILSGLQAPTSGTLIQDGQAVRFHSVREALSHGIAIIHQELNLVDELSVADNVFLGREVVKRGLLDREAMERETAQFVNEVGGAFSPRDLCTDLSIAGKQLVEIAKALAVDASVLIMDEPTAVLSEPEAEALYALISRLKSKGVTVVYISHRLDEVCRVCDRITVLRDGAWVKTVEGSDAHPQELASLMVGRALEDVYPPKSALPAGSPVLEARGFVVPGHVHEADLTVRPGEILGLAGLVGAGRTEFAEAIVGARHKSRGVTLVDGQAVALRSPRDAIRHGIAYVSEDRKGLGLHTSLSVVHNVTLANLSRYAKGVVDRRAETESAEAWKRTLDIRAGDLEAPVATLSGGNQQKVSVAKWLDTKPRVVILDEPTRGVDVGAKRELYALVDRLAREGTACVVVSSEMPEIIGLCHRALVMREGRVVGEVQGDDLTEDRIMALAAGVQAA